MSHKETFLCVAASSVPICLLHGYQLAEDPLIGFQDPPFLEIRVIDTNSELYTMS